VHFPDGPFHADCCTCFFCEARAHRLQLADEFESAGRADLAFLYRAQLA
jgi:hypothetical protein